MSVLFVLTIFITVVIVLMVRDVAVLLFRFIVHTEGTGAPSKRTSFSSCIGVFSVHSIGATGTDRIGGMRVNIIFAQDRIC